jgi:hypothetical protein
MELGQMEPYFTHEAPIMRQIQYFWMKPRDPLNAGIPIFQA